MRFTTGQSRAGRGVPVRRRSPGAVRFVAGRGGCCLFPDRWQHYGIQGGRMSHVAGQRATRINRPQAVEEG